MLYLWKTSLSPNMAMGQGGALGPTKNDLHHCRDWIHGQVPLDTGQPERCIAGLEGTLSEGDRKTTLASPLGLGRISTHHGN